MGFFSSSHSSRRSSFELEALEERRLLTTLVGPSTFYFLDARDEVIRIDVGPGTVAEFIGASVSGQQITGLQDLVQVFPGQDLPENGVDLFHVYVAQSNPDSWISISRMNTSPTPWVVEPYEGDLTFRINPNRGTGSPTVTPGPGQALIGALSVNLEGQTNQENRPLFGTTMVGGFGVRPDGLDDFPGLAMNLAAGLRVAEGVDMGRFLVGGTIIGKVHVPQSIELVYSGSLLTGWSSGQLQGAPAVPNNFFVGGDLRNLYVAGMFGADEVLPDVDPGSTGGRPLYVTGFDLFVGGRLGHVWGQESMMGHVRVDASQFAPVFPRPIREVQGQGLTADGQARNWGNGFPDNEVWDNNTFDTAQYVGSLSGGFESEYTHIQGTLTAPGGIGVRVDPVDYFAVSLLAGQQITVQLSSNAPVNVGVFDPDGRQIASDYSRIDPAATIQEAFTFTADRPGAYRFAVSQFGDFDFQGAPPAPPYADTYDLFIFNAGGIAVGGIVVAEQYFTPTANGIYVHAGDFGGLFAGGTIHGTLGFGAGLQTILVGQGNLRALEAGDIGPFVLSGVHIGAPNGHVGLIRATGDIQINPLFTADTPQMAIMGDFQLVHADGNFRGGLVANGNIGVVRAGSYITTPGVIGAFVVNANQVGRDGTIDLIDIAGNFGTFLFGGPAIVTGPGGNVRYIRVGGDVFGDSFFGGGSPQESVHQPGETVRFRDDSGSIVQLRAIGTVTENPNWNPLDPASPQFFGPQLTTVTYGVRGSGGVVIVRVDSTGGLQINTSGRTAEIGHININASGPGVVVGTVPPVGTTTRRFNPMQFGTPTDPDDPVQPMQDVPGGVDLRINGRARTDVFSVSTANLTHLTNRTGGEIVNVQAATIGHLVSRGTVGVARTTTGTALNGFFILADDYPFSQQRMGIVSGNIIRVAATGGVGNLIVNGSIGDVTVQQVRRVQGVFQGVRAPIFATGAIYNVSIGQGIAPTGAGDFAHSGIYAGGVIWEINGRGANIWGNVASLERIRAITLRDGAIIGANVMVITDLEMSRQIPGPFTSPGTAMPIEARDFRIGEISVRGRQSGIIGSYFAASDVGLISVRGGFGVLNSSVVSVGDGMIAGVRADGYGIRNVGFFGGMDTQLISATGRGQNLSTQQFNPAVRRSEGATNIDPLFGFAITRRNDLHAFLGTSEAAPIIEGITDAGVVENVLGQGIRSLDKLFAHRVRGATLNYANNINLIDIRDTTDGLFVTTGRMGALRIGSEALALDVRVSGLIDTLHVRGNFGFDSFIEAFGPDGEFGNIRIEQNQDGEIYAAQAIGSMFVGGDHRGTTTVDNLRGGIALGNARIVGDIWAPGFVVRGSVGRLDVGGVTESGDTLFINGFIDDFQIRRDLGVNLRVLGTANRITVGGSILSGSEIDVDDVIGTLAVRGDIEANATVRAWQLNRLQVGGQNNGTFIILG